MISDAFFAFIYAWVSGLAALLSGLGTVQPDPTIVGAVTTANGYVAAVYAVVPHTTELLLGLLAILVAFEGGYAGYKLVKWGYSKIPGIT